MSTSDKIEKLNLRAATYLVPSLPIEYFEAILHYVEKRMNCFTTLNYESRWEVPPSDRRNLFDNTEIDLAFMTSSAYLSLLERNSNVELLPISSVHMHPQAEDRPGHFIDVIVNKNIKDTVKDFIDLRGSLWAQNTNDSTGLSLTLYKLKAIGETANFFGNTLMANSYKDAIQMVINGRAQATAVDANVLNLYLKCYPKDKEEFAILTSWGPLPAYAIVVRKDLSSVVKDRIVDTLLNMNYDNEGARILSEFMIRRFAANSRENLQRERDFLENTKKLSFGTIYY